MKNMFLFVIAFVFLGMASDAVALDVGKPAPSFTLSTYDGQQVSLADLKGKVVVLEWFNKGCPFVVKHYQNGDMQALQEKYKSEGVEWLVINSTNKEHRDYLDSEKAKEVKAEWKINGGKMLADPTGEVGKLYGAKTTPHMFVIDKAGVLRYQGAIDDAADYDSNPKDAKNYVSAAVNKLLYGKGDDFITKSDPYGCSVKY